MTLAFLHGYLLAFSLILPLGVQNTFVFSQGALQRRWQAALPAVLTAALCDTLLITLAVSGVSLAILALPWLAKLLSYAGLIFMAFMGWVTWKSPAADSSRGAAEAWPLRRQVLFALSTSLLNPHAILDTVGVIGTGALAYSGQARLAFALGCVINSWIWFLALALAGYLVGNSRVAGPLKRGLNRISAVIMWAVGLQFAWHLLHA